jgi:hypothetical protein
MGFMKEYVFKRNGLWEGTPAPGAKNKNITFSA